MTSKLRTEAECIVKALRDAGHEAFFAGGCVRDMVMEMEPHDYDIATSATPEEITTLFPSTATVGAQFGVVVVHGEAGDYEVATFRADALYSDGRHPDRVRFCSAREDVRRRDFTINGMLYDPIEKKVLDWVGAQEDIKRGVVRAIGEPLERFSEDKLRILRAIRFAVQLGYAIEEETYSAICRCAPEIVAVSVERIRAELIRILTGPSAGRAVRVMHDTGLLAAVLPEVEVMAGVEQPPEFHPEGDVLEHTCLMLDSAENPSPELAVAVLLHDIGKPATQSFAERIRFNEHDRAGDAIAGHVCRRMRFSNEQTALITSLVRNHMRFMAVQRMKLSTLKRLLALPRFEEHLELHRLDCLASHGKLDNYEFLRRKMAEFSREDLEPAPLVSGRDLIGRGYPPGPIFRRILSAVRDEQLEDRLRTKDEAIAWVEKNFPLGPEKDA